MLLSALALWTVSSLLMGCEEPTSDGSSAPMWRVVAPNDEEGILIGTVHSVVDAEEIPDAFWDELAHADLVTTEAEVRHIDGGEFLELISLPEEVSLSELLEEDEWRQLVEAFEGVHDEDELARLQPWYVEGALLRTWLPRVNTIDVEMMQAAGRAGVRLAYLETWQEQVEMLNAVGVDDGLARLRATLADPEGTIEAHHVWADAYRRADVEELERLAFSEEAMSSRPRYFEEIVFARNESWLSTIEAQLSAGDAVIGVGFMHMFTDRGLLWLLEEDGFVVEQWVP